MSDEPQPTAAGANSAINNQQSAMLCVLLPAAGQSVRFGGGRSKLLELLAGEPVIRHSVRAFLSRKDVAAMVIAAPPTDATALAEALGELSKDPRVRFCPGGACR